jgi:hypothetical protein
MGSSLVGGAKSKGKSKKEPRPVGYGDVGKGEPHRKNRDLRRPAAPHAHPPYISTAAVNEARQVIHISSILPMRLSIPHCNCPYVGQLQ